MRGNNRDVSRAFAEDRESPSQGNNLYFVGRTMYSYGQHWPLAVKLSENKVLVNNDRYSVTTGKHRSYVAGALAVAGWTLVNGTKRECEQAMRDASYRAQLAAGPTNGEIS